MILSSQISFIQSLLQTSSLSDERVALIENEITNLTEDEGYEMINGLREFQLDPITHGARYTQTDIKNKLKHI